MQPKDFSKRRFKLIPGADYKDGPISKYGTFGNMLRVKMKERNKQIADNIPINAGELSDENTERITDFINPVRGMTQIGSKYAKRMGKEALEILTKENTGTVSKVPKLIKGNISKYVDEDMIKSIEDYSQYKFGNINRSLAKGGDGGKDFDGLKKLFKHEGDYYDETYRGTRLNRKELESLEPGSFIENRMVLSTSKDRGVAEQFKDGSIESHRNKDDLADTFIRIDNRQSPIHDIQGYALEPYEAEALLGPGKLLQVTHKPYKFPDGSYELRLKSIRENTQNILADKGQKVNNTLMSVGGLVGLGITNKDNE